MLEWFVSSAVLCALFIGLRYMLRGRIGLRLQYALWGLVLLRLLLPLSFGSSRLSVMNVLPGEGEAQTFVPAAFTLPDIGTATALPVTAQGSVNTDTAPSAAREKVSSEPVAPAGKGAEATPVKTPLDTGHLLRLLWLAGASVCFLWFAGVNLRFALALRKTRKQIAVADFPLPVFMTDWTETPCLFGLFRPAVYLPPEAMEDSALDHILAHEYTHFLHGDHLWSLLRSVAVVLHWFDPLAWWAAFLSRRDGELACDEGSLRRIGEGERTEYGRTLLRMTCANRPTLFRTATTMTGSKRDLKERIRLIAKKPRTAALTLTAVLLIAAVSAACTFTGAKPQATTEPKRSEDGRIILTIGAFQTDSTVNEEYDLLSWTRLNKAVDRFNATSKEYMAEIRSYGNAASADALYQLNAEILGGDMPDLLVTYGMPTESYGQKGLLLDLYQWYSPDQFFAGPLRSMETEGKLYSLSSSVEVFSFYGLESVLDRVEGYSMEDLYGAWEGFNTGGKAFIPQFSGPYIFQLLAALRMSEWVDKASMTCRFDSPEFISLLEFCRKLPQEAVVTESETYAQGMSGMMQMQALCVKNQEALLGLQFITGEVGSVLAQYADYITPLEGESVVFVGIPGTQPAAAGCVSELPLAVSAGSGSQEGARAFLDSLWDLRYTQIYESEMRSIPLKRSVLEDYIRYLKTYGTRTFTDESGGEYTAVYIGPNILPATDGMISDFLTLIESAAVPVNQSVSAVDPIILEESAACFAGTQSVEQTAKNIQTRYSLYLEEQKKR